MSGAHPCSFVDGCIPSFHCFWRRNGRLVMESASFHNGAIARHISQVNSSLRGDNPGKCNAQQYKRNFDCLFCYDKTVPEQLIEKPIGLSMSERKIGNNPTCIQCGAKGVILCATCTGSGLYVDSILESQGIIVKVRCLDWRGTFAGCKLEEEASNLWWRPLLFKGCGGTGTIICSKCGGRGHL